MRRATGHVPAPLGALAYALGSSDDGGFGEVLLMIAVMVAVQAEIVWRRAQRVVSPSQRTSGAVRVG